MNLLIVRGSNCAILIFASLLNEGQLYKKECSYSSKFFVLRVDPLWQGFVRQEVNRKGVNCGLKNDRKTT